MKNKKVAILIFFIIISVGIIIWIRLCCDASNFFSITFYDVIMLLATLFLGVVVAYYLPEKDTALRTYNNIYIEKIRELKDFIINECKKHMTDDYLLQDFDIYLLSDVKMLNNKIELLTKYAKNEEIKNLWAFIGKQYSEYKAVTTTDIKATKRSIKLREKGILNLDLIINKLDEIELKLFNY